MTASPRLLWATGGLSAALALALAPIVGSSPLIDNHALWVELDFVIGGGFTAVGLFTWYRRPDSPLGPLMVAPAFAWYLLVAAHTGESLLWTAGYFANHLFVATVIHLLLAFPSGRLTTTADRVVVAITYATTTILWFPTALFTDPTATGCTADCPENLLLVDSRPEFAGDTGLALSLLGMAIELSVLVRLAQHWRGASAPLRRVIAPVYLAGSVLIAGLLTLLVAGLAEGWADDLTADVFHACLIALGLVPILFLFGLVRGRWIRGRGLGALVSRLGQGQQTRELREELARALGDPSLELAYWLPEADGYVDAEGRPVELPGPGSGRAVTEVDREGRRIAAIVHDPALLEDAEQVHAAGAAAALALENERLEAELRAKVEQLSASRRRIVESSDDARRRLERDLHDGAQQRLVSLALNLRMLQSRVNCDPEALEELAAARAELDQALAELRELARGIHPSVLSDRGLGAALAGLAHRAPLPVELEDTPGERLPERIEAAAYFVVAEALTNVTRYASASQANVSVRRDNGHVLVEVNDDGVGGADPAAGSGLRGLLDRVAALGGRLEVHSPDGEGTTVRAAIPYDGAER